jgi:hypothetical protein
MRIIKSGGPREVPIFDGIIVYLSFISTIACFTYIFGDGASSINGGDGSTEE